MFGNKYDSSWFNQDAYSKYSWLKNSFNINLLYASIIGSLVNPIFSRKKNIVPSFLLASTLLILFLPEGHFWRVRPYMGLFIAMNISLLLLDSILYSLRKISVHEKSIVLRFDYSKVHSIMIVILIVSVYIITPMSLEPRLNFSTNQCSANNEGYFSQLLSYEPLVAYWIYDNNPKNWVRSFWWEELKLGGTKGQVALSKDTLIISDPYTMFMLEGLTGKPQALNERVWIDENMYSPEAIELMKNIKEVFMEGCDTYKKLNDLKGNFSTILIVITERTSIWTKKNNMFIWYPPSELDKNILSSFNDTHYYELVYCIPEKAYVFRVIPQKIFQSDKIIIDDCQSEFWNPVEDNVYIYNDRIDKTRGNSSINIKIKKGQRYYPKFIEKTYESPTDYTNADFFSFHFKGMNSGNIVSFGFDFPEGWVRYTFLDDFEEWKVIQFDKSSYTKSAGIIDWSKTQRLLFGTKKELKSDILWKIDYLRWGEYIPKNRKD
ncbi:MAG: hypothetical protein ACTSQY_02605 [Candidatus Odinarchaeia archaeon]